MSQPFPLPLTGLPLGEVSPVTLVCGDPARAGIIAAHLEKAVLLSEQREYRAYRGEYAGLPLTVCSHGIGAPAAAIAFEELIRAGARLLLRVGTCGSLQATVAEGQLVVASAAVQHTGYGRENFPPGFPAAATPSLVAALLAAARQQGQVVHAGPVLSRDVFYESGLSPAQAPDYRLLSQAGVLAVEMECAPLFLIGGWRGVETGAILAVDGVVLEKKESMESYAPRRPLVEQAVEAAIQVALHAVTGRQAA